MNNVQSQDRRTVGHKMLSDMLYDRFGTKVYKLSLTSGCTCPNRDGAIGTGGCTFCSEGGSGDFAAPLLPVREQIRLAKQQVDRKFPKSVPPSQHRYIAYFQSFTNTYGEKGRLEPLYAETLMQPEIVALSIGTRPDCLPDEMLDMLSGLQERMQKPVWLELGLQTSHDRTAEAFHRGYTLSVFEDAWTRLKARGLEGVLHVILGLPGESREDMLDTMRYVAALDPLPDGIKLQQLQILRGTEMGDEYLRNPFPLMTLEEYCALVRECLEILPPQITVHRLTGDGPKKLLIAPAWCADKKRVLNTMKKLL